MPTFFESGYPQLVIHSLIGLFAPAAAVFGPAVPVEELAESPLARGILGQGRSRGECETGNRG